MTSKETTIIAIKLIFLFLLMGMIIDAPATAMYIVHLSFTFLIETANKVESYWLVFWMVVVSIILIWVFVYILSCLLKGLIRTILSKDNSNSFMEETPLKFELTLLSIIGLYLLIDGFSLVIYELGYYWKESTKTFFYGLGIEGFMMVFSNIIEMIVGMVLMLFPKKVSLFLIDMRRDY